MKIYKVQTPLWWRTCLLNHVRCKKNQKQNIYIFEKHLHGGVRVH